MVVVNSEEGVVTGEAEDVVEAVLTVVDSLGLVDGLEVEGVIGVEIIHR